MVLSQLMQGIIVISALLTTKTVFSLNKLLCYNFSGYSIYDLVNFKLTQLEIKSSQHFETLQPLFPGNLKVPPTPREYLNHFRDRAFQ